jgi:hypothetical protein
MNTRSVLYACAIDLQTAEQHSGKVADTPTLESAANLQTATDAMRLEVVEQSAARTGTADASFAAEGVPGTSAPPPAADPDGMQYLDAVDFESAFVSTSGTDFWAPESNTAASSSTMASVDAWLNGALNPWVNPREEQQIRRMAGPSTSALSVLSPGSSTTLDTSHASGPVNSHKGASVMGLSVCTVKSEGAQAPQKTLNG